MHIFLLPPNQYGYDKHKTLPRQKKSKEGWLFSVGIHDSQKLSAEPDANENFFIWIAMGFGIADGD